MITRQLKRNSVPRDDEEKFAIDALNEAYYAREAEKKRQILELIAQKIQENRKLGIKEIDYLEDRGLLSKMLTPVEILEDDKVRYLWKIELTENESVQFAFFGKRRSYKSWPERESCEEFYSLSSRAQSVIISQDDLDGTKEAVKLALLTGALSPRTTRNYGIITHKELCKWVGLEDVP